MAIADALISACVDQCAAATKAQIESTVKPLVQDGRRALWIAAGLGVVWWLFKMKK